MNADRDRTDRELDACALVQAVAVALYVAQRTNSIAIIDLLFTASRLASEHAEDVGEVR